MLMLILVFMFMFCLLRTNFATREVANLYSNTRGQVSYFTFLRGLSYAIRESPCSGGDVIKHLHLQFEKIGFDKAVAAC
jgi:hypothetical protein